MLNSRFSIPHWFIGLFLATVCIVLVAMFYISSQLFSYLETPIPQQEKVVVLSPTLAPVATDPTIPPGASPTLEASPTLSNPPTATQPLSPPPNPTEASAPPPTTDAWVEQRLSAMSLVQKVGQMLLMGVDGEQMTSASCQQIQAISPGGIIYRSGNAVSPKQLRSFSASLQDCAQEAGSLPLLIAIDHEGQYVNRFNGGATIFPPALALGATGNSEYAYQAALASGKELVFSGVNMVLGPVADVLIDYDNTVISQRSFGGNPSQVSQFVEQSVRGYREAGLAPVLKHFPGHGGVSGDTHYTQALDPADLQRLQEAYLPSFATGINAGADVVMFGHVAFPNVTGDDLPATLSPNLVEYLRKQMGFQGVILTDSMGMAAITGEQRTVADASVQAVNAGVDLLMVTSMDSAQAAYNRLLKAARKGEIAPERIDDAVRRILSLKANGGLKSYPLPKPPVPDWEADASLAWEVGYHAVALLKDEVGLIPIPKKYKRILVIGPTDGWGLYPTLGAALQKTGISYRLVTYSNPWSGAVPETGYLQSLPNQASGYDLTLVFTWDAHLNRFRYNDSFQIDLVQRLLATDNPLVVVALKSPVDLLEFPQAPVYLATFGTTQGQVQGIVDALVGRLVPTGIDPLPDLIK